MKTSVRNLTDFLVGCVVIGVTGSLVNCGGSRSEMNHEIATAMPTAIPAVDSGAAAVTATAGVAMETIEAALANQPTRVDGVAAESTVTVTPIGAEATLQAAVNATLTALAPTRTLYPTPNLDATETAVAAWMVTAVSATLTAQAQSAATQTAQSPTRAPTTSPTELRAPSSLERVSFPSGSTAYSFATQLSPGLAKGYVLRTLAGQYLFIIRNNLMRIAVLDPDNFELTPFSTSDGQWVFRLTKTGDHRLVIAGDGSVTIAIDVPPLPEEIQFTPGSTSATFTLSLTQRASHAYTLWVAAGQQIFVTANQPIALLAFAPDGSEIISKLHDPFQWQFAVTQTGDQSIFLKGVGDVTVTIIIPPR